MQSSDIARARRFAAQLRVGNVYINQASLDGTLRQSGNGREHDEFGLGDFLELKAMAGYGLIAR